MSKREVLSIFDPENDPEIGDGLKTEKSAKMCSGNASRKTLADISNLPQNHGFSVQEEKIQSVCGTSKEHTIQQLKKEKLALAKMLAQKSEIIELKEIEAERMRVNQHKIQLQNLQLAEINNQLQMELEKLRGNLQETQVQNVQFAQTQSQLLMELNSAKDRLKLLQHELGCRNTLFRARASELEGEVNEVPCQNGDSRVEGEKAGESSKTGKDEAKPSHTKKRIHSGDLVSAKQVHSKDKAENKRPCARRQSARFRTEEPKTTDDSFETDDAKFHLPLPGDKLQESGSNSIDTASENDGKRSGSGARYKTENIGRSSLNRPLRQAAQKIQSYKEIPLNVKMRRADVIVEDVTVDVHLRKWKM